MHRILIFFMTLAAGITLGGCAAIVGGLSPTNMGDISETISLQTTPPEDILTVGIEIAQSMGYRLTGWSMARKTASLVYDARRNNPLLLLIGKVKTHRLQLTTVDAQSLAIEVHTTGNLGAGDFEDAAKILEEFRRKMINHVP